MSEMPPPRRRGIALGRAVPISTLPEIIEAPFPERRSIHWLPPDMITTEDFSIVITSEVLRETGRHVAEVMTHERGGFLLGNRYHCPNTGREYLVIDQYVEADFADSTDVSLTFTHEVWGRMEEELTGKYYGKKLVGWYHSHPGMSIFLSEHDIIIHKERFTEPWMVALVIEPEKNLGGFFVWSDDRIDPNHYVDFYELLSGQTRESAVTWKNYTGTDPLNGVIGLDGSDATVLAEASVAEPGAMPSIPDNSELGPLVPQGRIPVWLQGNLLRFGAATLAVIVFVGIVIALVVNRSTGSENKNANDNTNLHASELASSILNSLDVRLEDRGSVNFPSGEIKLWFTITGIREQSARKLRTRVTLDGREAQVVPSIRADWITVEATAVFREKAGKLKTTGLDSDGLDVKLICEYEGEPRTFDEFSVTKLQVLDEKPRNLAVANFLPPPTPTPLKTPRPTPVPTQKPPTNAGNQRHQNDQRPIQPPADSGDKGSGTVDQKVIDAQNAKVSRMAKELSDEIDHQSKKYKAKREEYERELRKLTGMKNKKRKPEDH